MLISPPSLRKASYRMVDTFAIPRTTACFLAPAAVVAMCTACCKYSFYNIALLLCLKCTFSTVVVNLASFFIRNSYFFMKHRHNRQIVKEIKVNIPNVCIWLAARILKIYCKLTFAWQYNWHQAKHALKCKIYYVWVFLFKENKLNKVYLKLWKLLISWLQHNQKGTPIVAHSAFI